VRTGSIAIFNHRTVAALAAKAHRIAIRWATVPTLNPLLRRFGEKAIQP